MEGNTLLVKPKVAAAPLPADQAQLAIAPYVACNVAPQGNPTRAAEE